mmetsp:Transcript_17712/g.44764  ORF Transcript_17712/g.44764 Transcript_17712/m.44764 type:complete len:284 (+) Transcript_17712:121-972(+)
MFFFVQTNFSTQKIFNQFSKFNSSKFLFKDFSKITRKSKNLIFSLNALDFPKSSSKKLIRLNTDETIQKIIINLQKVSDEKTFFDFCITNREHLSYCLLYRLTALKLKAESDLQSENQSKNIQNFRKKILENILFVDQPVSQALILSEKRIKEIMESSLEEKLVLRKIGEDATSVTCFWIVMQAALFAWKKKEDTENLQNKTEIYEKLKKIKKIFNKSQKHISLLAHELVFLQKSFENEAFLNSNEKKRSRFNRRVKGVDFSVRKITFQFLWSIIGKNIRNLQ